MSHARGLTPLTWPVTRMWVTLGRTGAYGRSVLEHSAIRVAMVSSRGRSREVEVAMVVTAMVVAMVVTAMVTIGPRPRGGGTGVGPGGRAVVSTGEIAVPMSRFRARRSPITPPREPGHQ